MQTILIVIIAAEAFVLGAAVGYAEGFTRARKTAMKIIDQEMDDFVKSFNGLIDDLYEHTGYELPKLPARKVH